MMAFSVAEKAARLAGSFNTSSADRASSADTEGVDGEPPGFCAEDGAGRPRRMAHRMMRIARVISGERLQMSLPGQRDFGHDRRLPPNNQIRREVLRRSSAISTVTLHKPGSTPIVK